MVSNNITYLDVDGDVLKIGNYMTRDDISWRALVQTSYPDDLWNKTEMISFLTFPFIL